jgi:hypothetical protein
VVEKGCLKAGSRYRPNFERSILVAYPPTNAPRRDPPDEYKSGQDPARRKFECVAFFAASLPELEASI